MSKTYRILTAAQTEGEIILAECDMEFDGPTPFAIHTYYEGEGHTSKQRIELDPLKLQKPVAGQTWKTANGEYDYFYQGLIVFPTPRDN